MSGRINTGGGNSSYFYFQWQLAGQDENGNYSTINWQAGIHLDGGAWWGTNAVRLDGVWINGSGNITSGTWSNISGNGDHHLRSGSWTIGHNGDGGKSFSASVQGWLYATGTFGNSGSWGLPGLYQGIGFDSININTVSDTGFKVYADVNRTANLLQLSIDGGGWTTYHSGDYGAVTVQVGGSNTNALRSGKQYSVRLRVRRASNGNITDSGTHYVTTAAQNKFFDIGDF